MVEFKDIKEVEQFFKKDFAQDIKVGGNVYALVDYYMEDPTIRGHFVKDQPNVMVLRNKELPHDEIKVVFYPGMHLEKKKIQSYKFIRVEQGEMHEFSTDDFYYM